MQSLRIVYFFVKLPLCENRPLIFAVDIGCIDFFLPVNGFVVVEGRVIYLWIVAVCVGIDDFAGLPFSVNRISFIVIVITVFVAEFVYQTI